MPSLERVVVSSRTPERAQAFAKQHGAEVAGSPADAGGCDVVVTATTSRDPVLRGDWLRDGALVCAIGANDPAARELDAQVISRATLVCCDSLEDARLESGDLIEPVAAGQLDWLEVCELHQIVTGELRAVRATTTSSSSSRTGSLPGTSRSGTRWCGGRGSVESEWSCRAEMQGRG